MGYVLIGLNVFLLDFPYYLLAAVPFMPSLRVPKPVIGTGMVLTGILHGAAIALAVAFLPEWRTAVTFISMAHYALCILQFLLYFRDSPLKIIYVFLIIQAIATVINAAGRFIDFQMFPETALDPYTVQYTLITLALMVVLLPFLWWYFRGRLRKDFEAVPASYFGMLCITPLLFFIIILLFSNTFNRRMYSDANLFALMAFVSITGIITYLLTLRMVMVSAQRAKLLADNQSMEQQLQYQAEGYDKLTESIERARAARHDLRHHLSVIDAYLEQDDRPGLTGYLAEYRRSLPEDTEAPVCKNYTVDVIVRHYLAGARAAGAEIDVKLDLPREAGIPDADLCIVFGNLFENAANAVTAQKEGHRYIRARCDCENGRIVLTVDNSVGAATARRRAEGGMGQLSVRAVAEKYGGGVRFQAGNGEYRSSVMMLRRDA